MKKCLKLVSLIHIISFSDNTGLSQEAGPSMYKPPTGLSQEAGPRMYKAGSLYSQDSTSDTDIVAIVTPPGFTSLLKTGMTLIYISS